MASNVVTHRQKGEETGALIFGIVAMIILTAIVYYIGFMVSQSDNFAPRTNFGTVIKAHSGRYFAASAATIVQLVLYIIMFKLIGSRSETEWSCIPSSGGSKYIYSGWVLSGIIGAVVVYICAIVVHYIAFQQNASLIKPLMWWVVLLQALTNGAIFFIPPFKPLKKFGN